MQVIFEKKIVLKDAAVPRDIKANENYYDISTLCEYGVLFWRRSPKNVTQLGLYFELSKEMSEKYKDNKNIIICLDGYDGHDWKGKHAEFLYKLDNDYGYIQFCSDCSCTNCRKVRTFSVRLIDIP